MRIKIAFAVTVLLLVTSPFQSALASVTVGGLTYSIQGVSRASSYGPEGIEQTAAGEFIVVKLTLKNVGTESADISASDFHLKRGDTQYDADNGMVNMSLFLEKLNPGVSKSGTIVFDVPANTSPSKYSLVIYGNGNGESKNLQL